MDIGKNIQELRKKNAITQETLAYELGVSVAAVSKFIDTPLDVALARRILRDMKDATADEIRNDLKMYLKYARIAFVQMHKDILPSSDYVIEAIHHFRIKIQYFF